MIFLIEYDRRQGVMVQLQEFPDEERSRADEIRSELEAGLVRSRLSREVVILQAASEEALRKTHARYFAGLAELMQ